MRFSKLLLVLILFMMSISVYAQENVLSYEQISEYEVGTVRDMVMLTTNYFVVASDSGLWVLKPYDAEIQHWETAAPVSRLFYFNGSEVGLVYEDNSMGIWDVLNGVELSHYSGHSGAINTVLTFGAAEYLISGSDDGTVRMWNVATASEEAIIFEGESPITQFAYYPYTYMLAALSEDNSVHLWLYLQRQELGVLHFDEDVTSIGFNPRSDSPDLLLGTADGKIHVWPILSQESFEYEGVSYPLYIVPLPDGTEMELALTRQGRRDSGFIDPNNPKDGEIVWQGNWRTLSPVMASIETLSESLVLDTHTSSVARFVPNFRLIISIGEDNTIVGRVEDYTEFYQLDLSADAEVIFLNEPRNTFFASVHDDNSVSIWSAEFGTEASHLPAQTAKTTHIAMGGQLYLASATEDGILHLWQLSQ